MQNIIRDDLGKDVLRIFVGFYGHYEVLAYIRYQTIHLILP